MSHERWMEIGDIQHKNEVLDAMTHNLRVAGENNYGVRLKRLQVFPDMMLQSAYSDTLWKVIRKFDNGQVLVKHEAVHENDQDHVSVWGKNHSCRVPRGLL